MEILGSIKKFVM